MKTVVPFIVWTLINFGIKVFVYKMEFKADFSEFIKMFTNTTIEQVYWFFIPLFMIYLSMPALSLLKDYKHILAYMAGMAFLIYSVYPVFCTFLKIPVNGSIQFPVASGYLLYVILGYLISTSEMSRKTRWFLYVLGALGAALRYGSTVLWSSESTGLNQTFWGYTAFPAVFLAVAVFVAAKYFPWDKIEQKFRFQNIVSSLAGTGFGVYLMHMIIFRVLQKLTGLGMGSGWWRFVMPFVIYGICVVLVMILKKIPVLKHIVP